MIGLRTASSDKRVCTGLVATTRTRFRCRIVVIRNERSKRAKPTVGLADSKTRLTRDLALDGTSFLKSFPFGCLTCLPGNDLLTTL